MTKAEMIQAISAAQKYTELFEELLNQKGKIGLRELSREELEQFCKDKKLV